MLVFLRMPIGVKNYLGPFLSQSIRWSAGHHCLYEQNAPSRPRFSELYISNTSISLLLQLEECQSTTESVSASHCSSIALANTFPGHPQEYTVAAPLGCPKWAIPLQETMPAMAD